MNAFQAGPDSVTWRGDGETLLIQAWGRNSVRVRAVPSGEVLDTEFGLLQPEAVPAEVDVEDGVATLTNGDIVVVLRSSDFFDEQVGYQVFRCSLEVRDSSGAHPCA